jgi:hypothetical protein
VAAMSFQWPPAGSYLALSGQFLVAVVTRSCSGNATRQLLGYVLLDYDDWHAFRAP